MSGEIYTSHIVHVGWEPPIEKEENPKTRIITINHCTECPHLRIRFPKYLCAEKMYIEIPEVWVEQNGSYWNVLKIPNWCPLEEAKG
jgi:hypothetical protein